MSRVASSTRDGSIRDRITSLRNQLDDIRTKSKPGVTQQSSQSNMMKTRTNITQSKSDSNKPKYISSESKAISTRSFRPKRDESIEKKSYYNQKPSSSRKVINTAAGTRQLIETMNDRRKKEQQLEPEMEYEPEEVVLTKVQTRKNTPVRLNENSLKNDSLESTTSAFSAAVSSPRGGRDVTEDDAQPQLLRQANNSFLKYTSMKTGHSNFADRIKAVRARAKESDIHRRIRQAQSRIPQEFLAAPPKKNRQRRTDKKIRFDSNTTIHVY